MVSKAFSPLIILTLPALLLFSSPLKGQVKDAGLWTTVSFEAKLGRKLSLDISQEFRFNENITELGTAYTDAGLTYKLNKHFQIAANYRYTQKRTIENYYSFRHRIYIDIKYEKKNKTFPGSVP